MKALYIFVVTLFVSSFAFAGALNRIGAVGTTDTMYSDPDGVWPAQIMGGQLKLHGSELVVGTEVMAPKFKFRFNDGRKLVSKNIYHVLPFVAYRKSLNEETEVGLEIKTQFGLGASFPKSMYNFDSSTLVSGTYIQPYLARKLTDKLSIKIGPIIGFGMLNWDAPFDVNRTYLPINTLTKAYGIGFGVVTKISYQITDEFAVAIGYTSKVSTKLSGQSHILLPGSRITDKISTHFDFPDKLDLTVSYKPNDQWLASADIAYFGYSQSSCDQVGIRFHKLGINKPVALKWQDDIAVHFGLARKFNEHWTIGGGFAYMSQAIPSKTADFLTPDINGWSIGAKAQYHFGDNCVILAANNGFGSSRVDSGKFEVSIWTVALSGNFKFKY